MTLKSLVLRMSLAPCDCGPCTVAGVGRPWVELRRTKNHPQRELHGTELRDWWAAEDRAAAGRQALVAQLRRDHLERVRDHINRRVPGAHAQRGDEPR